MFEGKDADKPTPTHNTHKTMAAFGRRFSRSHSGHELDDDFQARHTVLGNIGRGSFGAVTLIKYRRKGQTKTENAAMKVASLAMMTDKERDQAKVEVAHLAELKHPNIIGYYESFILNCELYIIMEYANGGALDSVLRSHKENNTTIPTTRIKRWFTELLLAVGFVHSQQKMHRDIKTGNIFLHKNVIKLGDFGLARAMDGHTCNTHCGTPYYLAPELLSGGYSYPADVWACGVVLYELCTNRRPFPAQNMLAMAMKINNNNPDEMSEILDTDLIDLRTNMMISDPNKRMPISSIMRLDWIQHELDMIQSGGSGGGSGSGSGGGSSSSSGSSSGGSVAPSTTPTRHSRSRSNSGNDQHRMQHPLTPPAGPPPPFRMLPPPTPPPQNSHQHATFSESASSLSVRPARGTLPPSLHIVVDPPPLAASNTTTTTTTTTTNDSHPHSAGDDNNSDQEEEEADMTKSSTARARVQRVADNIKDLQHSNRRRGMLALAGAGKGGEKGGEKSGGTTTTATTTTENTASLDSSMNVAKHVKPKTTLKLQSTTSTTTTSSPERRSIGEYGLNPFAAAHDGGDDDVMRRLSHGLADMIDRSPVKEVMEYVLGGPSSSSSEEEGEEGEEEENRGYHRSEGEDSFPTFDEDNCKENEKLQRHDSVESTASLDSQSNRTSTEVATYKFRFSVGDQNKGTPPRMSAHGRESAVRSLATGGESKTDAGTEAVVAPAVSMSMLRF